MQQYINIVRFIHASLLSCSIMDSTYIPYVGIILLCILSAGVKTEKKLQLSNTKLSAGGNFDAIELRHDDVMMMSQDSNRGIGFDFCPPKCQCYNGGLINCSRLALTSVPKLPQSVVSIDLSLNDIQHLSDGSFKDLPLLTTVDLSGNKLNDTSFTNKSFAGSLNLQTLYLGYNNFHFVPRYLPKQIVELALYNNKIANMSLAPLTNYPSIKYLRLDNNIITGVPDLISQSTPNLTQLDLSFNQITDAGIKVNSFKGLTKLQTLSFRFNQMTKVPSNLPTSLLHFDMVGNPIQVIQPYAFQHQNKLETLEIWQSGLKTLSDNSFYGLGNLTILDLMECHVETKLTNKTLAGLSSVQTVDISLSKIPSIEVGAFKGLTALQQLWLNDNPLKTLPEGVFSHAFIPSISIIYLWGDQWVCDCHLKWLKVMQESGDVIQDPGLMKCKEPMKLNGKLWSDISADDFTC
ncbi:lumican-like [Ciona intestinalis]